MNSALTEVSRHPEFWSLCTTYWASLNQLLTTAGILKQSWGAFPAQLRSNGEGLIRAFAYWYSSDMVALQFSL